MTVHNAAPTADVFTEVLGFQQTRQYKSEIEGRPDILIFETGECGNGSEIHPEERIGLQAEHPGRGSVHHVAFRGENEEELRQCIKKVDESRFSNSGFVDRFYFHSLYFREPNGILFKLATDSPGFASDEHVDYLRENLALPPFLESMRARIEQQLKTLATK